MDLSVVLQVILNIAIVVLVIGPPIIFLTRSGEKLVNLKDDFIRWRQRHSRW